MKNADAGLIPNPSFAASESLTPSQVVSLPEYMNITIRLIDCHIGSIHGMMLGLVLPEIKS